MSTRQRRTAIALIAAIAFAAKLLLALKTYGTNDVYTYERFGLWSRYFGVELYKIAPDLNHPPSMLHILSFILRISEITKLPFQFCLRFPGILADAGTLWLICRIVGDRIADRAVFIGVLLVAIAPINILISGYHGNTDPIMIFFVLAAVWLAGYRDNAVAGGMALGMAFCIKIAPVVVVPVLFLSLPGARRRILFFGAAGAVVVAGWSPYVFQDPSAVAHQVFGYKSSYGLWGLSWLFRQLDNAWPAFHPVDRAYSERGSLFVLGAILILSIWMNRMKRKPSLYAQAGMVFLFFFSVTSGFAVQYLAWLTPWVAELGALPVGLFVLTGSTFLLVVYDYWNLGMPWYLAIAYPWSSHHYFQALCWVSVVIMTFVAWRHIRGTPVSWPALRIRPAFRWSIAAFLAAAFVGYPAVVRIRHERLGVAPVYGEDIVLYSRADANQNLVTELSRHGRNDDASRVQRETDVMNAQAQVITDQLARSEPARLTITTPETWVDASLDDYNNGNFVQCIYDATESLKFRPAMPAAWNNIALCHAELGQWDVAIAAEKEAVRIEPESDEVRKVMDSLIEGKRRAGGGR